MLILSARVMRQNQALFDYDGNVLVYLNEYLFAREANMKFALGNKYDIEHIMPYSGYNLQEKAESALY